MCLAILKPAGKAIPDEHLRNGWLCNPDGGGYGYVNDEGEMVVRKGFRKLKEFIESYKKDAEKFKESPFLVHFRIRTMGANSDDNTHPFLMEHGMLIHNGTINGTGAVSGVGKSDTALFAETFSKDFTFDFLHCKKSDIEKALNYNKVAVLFKDKRWIILNDDIGRWDNDVWYSNGSYGYNTARYHGSIIGDGWE